MPKQNFKLDDVITITRDGGELDDAAARARKKKGALDSDYEQDYQARRLQSKKGLEIYDVGSIRNPDGSFRDFLFHAAPVYSSFGQALPVTRAQYTAKAAAILSENVELFESKFRKITRTTSRTFKVLIRLKNYNFVTSPEFEFWSEDGESILFPDQAVKFSEHFFWGTNPYQEAAYINPAWINPSGYFDRRVTLEPRYDGALAPASLKMDGDEKLFMLPSFCYASSHTTGLRQSVPIPNSLPEASFGSELLNYHWTYPRVGLAALHDWFASNSFRVFNDARFDTNTLANWQNFNTNRDFLVNNLAQSAVHLLRIRYQYTEQVGGQIFTRTTTRTTSEPLADHYPYPDIFPAPPALPIPYTGTYNGAREYRSSWSNFSGAGDLMSVIKKSNGVVWYVWNTYEEQP